MRFIIKKYRIITIWLSLLIICFACVVGSDRPSRPVCVPTVFILGMFLYLLGGIREWHRDHVTTALVELLLAVCMLTGAFLSLMRQGGFL